MDIIGICLHTKKKKRGRKQLAKAIFSELAHQEERHGWYWKLYQLPRISAVIDLRKSTTNLLNSHKPYLHSKYLPLYLQISVVLTPNRGNFFLL